MKHVLVIEDDDLLRSILREILEDAGYRVSEAADGELGIKQMNKRAAQLVITDIIMPGKEGIETIVELQQDFPHVPIIAISGGSLKGAGSYLPTAEAFGASATLRKPFGPSELLTVVRRLIEERRVGEKSRASY